MMTVGTLDVKPLITHRYKIDDATKAYELLDDSSALGILLEYPVQEDSLLRTPIVQLDSSYTNSFAPSDIVVGFIGAGNYASRTLIPAFKDTGVQLDTLVTSGGISGVYHGNKAGFRIAATELDELWNSSKINTVVIVTRHDAHAAQVQSALESGYNVFVEKPLALRLDELDAINSTFQRMNESRSDSLRLMVGFNRRYAPHVVKMKSLLENKREPKTIVITVNAGAIPVDHWTQDHDVGGGRIVGEGCHFIDLMRFLIGHPITEHQAMMIGSVPSNDVLNDKVSINLSFADGSFGTIHYLANGGKSFPKERIEVFCGESVLQMDNYRILRGYDWPGFKKMKLMKQNKGQIACTKAFVEAIKSGKPSPIPYEEVMESSRVSIEVAESLRLR